MNNKEDRQSLNKYGIFDLRRILRSLGGTPGTKLKSEIIDDILRIQGGEKPVRNPRGRKAVSVTATSVGIEAVRKQFLPEKTYSPEGQNGQEKPFSPERRHTAERKNAPERQSAQEMPLTDPALVPAEKDRPLAVITDKSTGDDTVNGVLELHADGYGFLRAKNYETLPNGDTFVSRQTVKGCWLRRGDFVVGRAARTRDTGSSSLVEVLSVNGLPPRTERSNFDDLVPCYPDRRINLSSVEYNDDYTLRVMDLLCPLGYGQRGLIVAPPKTGKTTLLKKVAQSIGELHPEAHLIVLLIDERPEEVTDMRRSVKDSVEVVYSTFDETPEHHIRAAELVMWRAKRLVELGENVVILLDSITRLTRAYNQVVPSSGKILSGGIDPAALQAPKKFFGAARNIEHGGSLTILATALIETGSKMDDLIYEEFKGTGNMELRLTRELAEHRIFPAIDLYASGTRKEELLLNKNELECTYLIRRFISKDSELERFFDMIKRTENNDEFVSKFPAWVKLMSK